MRTQALNSRLIAVVLGALLAQGCADDPEGKATCAADSSLPCNEDPWVCGAAETCWFTSDPATLSCLPAGDGEEGGFCSQTPDGPTCGENQLCVSLQGQPNLCRHFCEPSDPCKACPEGRSCRRIQLDEAGFTNVCLP